MSSSSGEIAFVIVKGFKVYDFKDGNSDLA
jgi:hypothetical protein